MAFGARKALILLIALISATAVAGAALAAPPGRGTGMLTAGPVAQAAPVAGWQAMPVPQGPDNPLSRGSWLAAAACAKPEICVAFGGFGGRGGTSEGLLAQLRGTHWTAVAAPTAGLLPPARPGGQGFVPGAVACPAVGHCVAVGSYTSVRGYHEGVIESQSADGWTARTAPLAGLVPVPGGDPHILFSQLACPTERYCVALGSYEGAGRSPHALVEVLRSGTWTAGSVALGHLSPAPAPGRAAQVRLAGLSCWASGGCALTGTYRDAEGSTLGLYAHSAGPTWSASTIPTSTLVPGTGPGTDIELAGLACPGPAVCFAVGTYRQDRGEVEGFAEELQAGTWTATTLPIGGLVPGPAGPVALSPAQLSCPSADFCAVVGTYHDLYGDIQAFGATYAAGRWQLETLPIYSLSPTFNPKGLLALDGLDCVADGRCTASGFYGGTYNQSNGVIEQLGEGTWTALTAPLGGLVPAATGFPGAQLDGLGCAGPSFCVLVGDYSGPAGSIRGLAETFSA